MTNKKVKHLNVEKRIDNLYQVWYFSFGNVIINDKGGDALKKTKEQRQTIRSGSLFRRMWKNKWVYILFIPTFVFFAVFSYASYYGIAIAFVDFKPYLGISGSEWVGLKHFKNILSDRNLLRLLYNTLKISVLRIIFAFPVPIIFALILNEVKTPWFKKLVQTVTCFPNFISWVVFAGIVFTFTGPTGVINQVLINMGKETVNLTTNPDAFIPLIIITDILKSFGWSSIIYMASISGVDPQLYDAAAMDGAGRLRQTWHVTLPGIRPVIALQLLLSVANVLSAGFDQIFMFLKPALYNVGDILDTYVYRIGLLSGKYEIGTAMGLMKSVVSMILIIIANSVIRKMGEKSLW